ncbi:hypothetical protein D9M68_830990 [compost metagenome]
MGEFLEQRLLLRKHLLTEALEALDDMAQSVLSTFCSAADLMLLLIHMWPTSEICGGRIWRIQRAALPALCQVASNHYWTADATFRSQPRPPVAPGETRLHPDLAQP